MGRSTRTSYSCARCYKRKKKCDRNYPSCSQCTIANAKCIALDRGSNSELPRSLVSYLEDIAAQLKVQRDTYVQNGIKMNLDHVIPPPLTLGAVHYENEKEKAAAYSFAARTAACSPPVALLNRVPRYTLPYYRGFFKGAELPFPLAFQGQQPSYIPCSHGGANFTQLPEEVADKLMTAYIERILPQYPLFLRRDISDIFQRFKTTGTGHGTVTPDEQFTIYMIMAIATLSSRTRNYRKLLSVAESLRRDAFSCLDFGLSANNVTTTTIQQLLLLAQYGFLLPSSTSLWQVVGDASRIALELGLHQETPAESGLDEQIINDRKRLYWTLYAIERSVAITSHRPFAVGRDQIHVSFPRPTKEIDIPDQSLDTELDESFTQVPYIRFIDRLQYLRLQTEICSINIGMRPIPDPHITHENWLVDVDMRIAVLRCQVANAKWCNFMEWHTILLLNMPCARNPHPTETSVLKYFDAAVQIARGYWELVNSGNLNYPWHATHQCYEAGNLLLYGLWYYHDLIHGHYTTAQVFEAIHHISGNFILLEKKWPGAQQCGMLFDRLRKKALSSFGEEDPSEPELSAEARQLKELVFRENADFLYAREQPSAAVEVGGSIFNIPFPDFDKDGLSFEQFTDFPGFFNFSETPALDGFDELDQDLLGEHTDQPDLSTLALAAPSENQTNSPRLLEQPAIDKNELRMAVQNLQVCSPCRKRRTKCDMHLPACRNCVKYNRECRYWDSALGKDIPRKDIDVLYAEIDKLIDDVKELAHPIEPAASSAIDTVLTGHLHDDTISTILCANSSDAAKPIDMVFYAVTSSFCRLASVGRSISLPNESSICVSQPSILLETVCSSLISTMTLEISQPEAQTLAWHYYQSIEILYPILGEDLISQTLGDVCNSDLSSGDDKIAYTRLNLVLAISLALLSVHDHRLQVVADTYFRDAISSGISRNYFLEPDTQSLQLILLLCVYAWIRPSTMNIWRLLGHASRVFLDVIEAHGSDKTDSTSVGALYRTLYTLETHIAISFGRPHQLPDRQDLPALLQDPDSVTSGELSTMRYDLARLQNRFHRDSISDGRVPGQVFSNSVINNPLWLTTCVNDIKAWLEGWNVAVDAFIDGSLTPRVDGDALRALLKLHGELEHCEALLLAKSASDRHGQLLISSEDELAICRQLLWVVGRLHQHQHQHQHINDSTRSLYPLQLVYPLTWTCAHAISSAMLLLLQHTHRQSQSAASSAEMQRRDLDLFYTSIETLDALGRNLDWDTKGLVSCMRSLAGTGALETITAPMALP